MQCVMKCRVPSWRSGLVPAVNAVSPRTPIRGPESTRTVFPVALDSGSPLRSVRGDRRGGPGCVMICQDSSCRFPLRPFPSFRPEPPGGRRSGGISSQDSGSCRTDRVGNPSAGRDEGQGVCKCQEMSCSVRRRESRRFGYSVLFPIVGFITENSRGKCVRVRAGAPGAE